MFNTQIFFDFPMKKKIILLGSTGSIGSNTLEILAYYQNEFDLVGISAHSNRELLKKQCGIFQPGFICISDPEYDGTDMDRSANGARILKGTDGIQTMIREAEADLVVNSIVGAAGLLPTLEAIKTGKNVALANKESLVVAGQLIMAEAKKHNVELYPVDSEHSAIWQCLLGESTESITGITLTASGGPFLDREPETFDTITVDEALNHPNWVMGKKITIDSATLANKGFEVIETHWLYGIDIDCIDVVIHPQSIIHSFVEFIDGSVKAQLGYPDMKIPIQFALFYPERRGHINGERMNLSEMNLTFDTPDHTQFPCLGLAYQALKSGGTAPAVLNAANEVAVQLFLENKIKFSAISEVIHEALKSHTIISDPVLEDYLEADNWARNVTKEKVS